MFSQNLGAVVNLGAQVTEGGGGGGGGGGRWWKVPSAFLWTLKKWVPILEKYPDCVHLCVNFLIYKVALGVFRYLKEKALKCFPEVHFFHVL